MDWLVTAMPPDVRKGSAFPIHLFKNPARLRFALEALAHNFLSFGGSLTSSEIPVQNRER
jgi:hypothetical protein